jgi:ribosomal protein L37AE/L43A
MPRTRKSGNGSRSRASVGSAQTDQVFTCPECGRTFGRAAALGAHRRRAHGVVGAKTRTRPTPSLSTSQKRSGASSRRRAGTDRHEVNRDALLRAVFPSGVPPREAVIRAANSWLDEANRLSSMK